MAKDYVSQVNDAYRVSGTRVSLDSVVYAYLKGQSPKSIVDSFPVLTLEQVHGTIAYYLAHQTEVDDYLRQGEVDFEALRQRLREQNLPLRQKLVALKQKQQEERRVAEAAQP